MSSSLFNVEVECHSLAILLKDPAVWGDFHLITRDDWSEANRPVYDIIALQLNSTPPASLDPMLLTERMRSIGISQLVGGVEIFDYLSGLKNRYVEKKEAPAYAKELKRLSVRRELIAKMDEAKKALVQDGNATFEEMTSTVEKNLSSVTTAYHKPEVTELFSTMEGNIEKRADNPINPDEQLYQGPIASINRTVGPIIFPGSFSTTIARTSAGKSAFSFFYCVHVAERYNLPILWLDAGEMTLEQIQMRAVACLSEGRIPLWMVRTGEWRKHPAMLKLVRGELWPRVKKLRLFYRSTAGMSPKDKVSFVRRFHYSKIGRDEFLIVAEDYLKGVEALGSDRAEYQSVGYYVSDMKSLVTEELNAGYWSSLQSNRMGITKGKKPDEMQDHEGSASLSDRIAWECTNQFFLRVKEPAELAMENNLFGSVILKPTKVREGYGREYEKLIRPIKMANGRFALNHFNMGFNNFHYIDKGLYSEALEALGQTAVTMPVSAPPGGSKPI